MKFEDLAIIVYYIDRFKEKQNEVRLPDCTTIDCEGKLPLEIILALLLFVVVVCFGVSMFILMKNRRKIQKFKTRK